MTDFELCYIVMVILYLMECCLLLPENSVLFTRVFRGWRVTRSPGCAFAAGKRLVLIHPFPLAGEWHAVPFPDATYTDRGIITLNSLHDYPQGFAPPQTLRPDSAAGASWLRVLAAAGCPVAGREFPPPDPRPGEPLPHEAPPSPDPALARWTDPAPVRERYRKIRGGLLVLRTLCLLQFLWAFVAAPLLLTWFSLERAILPFVFALFWLGGSIALSFAALHRRLHGPGWTGAGKALWLFLYPLAAMRAAQTLCNEALPPCHESALAGVLMTPEISAAVEDKAQGRVNSAFTAYLDDLALKLTHRLFCRSLSQADSQALAKANENLLRAIHAHWGAPAQLRQEPAAQDAATVCYCPVCGIAMAVDMEYCPHCLEVRTLPCSR